MKQNTKYLKAIELIDEKYQEELTKESFEGKEYCKEYLYALRMVEELQLFKPAATEDELLAARCQHFCRWEIPRKNYPMDRKGYHQWRTYLYTYQANNSAKILATAGYDDEFISKVKTMVSKTHLKINEQSQLIEDVACLVFLKYYIEEFATKHQDDEVKMTRIIHNTWIKMSEAAHESALKIPFSKAIGEAIKKALQ